jgi:hypothetical protein
MSQVFSRKDMNFGTRAKKKVKTGANLVHSKEKSASKAFKFLD